MAGMRIGGVAFIPIISPPFGAMNAVTNDSQVWRASTTDPPKTAVEYTDLTFAVAENCSNPLLSPDGSKIIFQTLSGSTGFYDIWVVDNAPGSTPTLLLTDPSEYWFMPFWAPDSDAFVCIHGGQGAGTSGSLNGDLVLTSVSDPSTQTVLKSCASAGGGDVEAPFRPQFSPDGQKIAYWWDTDPGVGLELRVMDADGSNDMALHTEASGSYRFQGPQYGWSNDSSLIAFDDGVASPVGIFTIAPDGTGLQQINGAGVAEDVGRISHLCFPPGDGYVVIAANLGSGYAEAIRCELDGSNTTSLNGTVGANGSLGVFYEMLVFEGRLWFIEPGLEKVSAMALDGTGYVNVLDMDDQSLMLSFGGGDGWYFN